MKMKQKYGNYIVMGSIDQKDRETDRVFKESLIELIKSINIDLLDVDWKTLCVIPHLKGEMVPADPLENDGKNEKEAVFTTFGITFMAEERE